MACLMSADILVGKLGLPAESRWGSVTSTNAKVALGLLCHDLLRRAWKLAFPTWEDGGAGLEGESEEFHLTMQKKVYRVGKFFGERSGRSLVMSFTTEPLDWLWHRLQYLDEQGRAYFDISSPTRSPFVQAQVLRQSATQATGYTTSCSSKASQIRSPGA